MKIYIFKSFTLFFVVFRVIMLVSKSKHIFSHIHCVMTTRWLLSVGVQIPSSTYILTTVQKSGKKIKGFLRMVHMYIGSSALSSYIYSRFELLLLCALLLFNFTLSRRSSSIRCLAEFFLGGIFALENIIRTRIFCFLL